MSRWNERGRWMGMAMWWWWEREEGCCRLTGEGRGRAGSKAGKQGKKQRKEGKKEEAGLGVVQNIEVCKWA